MRTLAPAKRILFLREHLRSVADHVGELAGMRAWEICRAAQGLAARLEEEEHASK